MRGARALLREQLETAFFLDCRRGHFGEGGVDGSDALEAAGEEEALRWRPLPKIRIAIAFFNILQTSYGAFLVIECSIMALVNTACNAVQQSHDQTRPPLACTFSIRY
jgi:hypothetical protein